VQQRIVKLDIVIGIRVDRCRIAEAVANGIQAVISTRVLEVECHWLPLRNRVNPHLSHMNRFTHTSATNKDSELQNP
jgi:hypothetical protein